MKSKKGWIRIVEAFIAILIIAGILLIVLGEGYISAKDNSEKIYNAQISMLREIQFNETLRGNAISEKILPIKNNLGKRIPSYLNCTLNLCEINSICEINLDLEKDVYSQEAFIGSGLFTDATGYSWLNYVPKKLKLFCWEV